ncbi:hsp70 family protein [Aporhodopirellula aestuarii]|uniref:Hsp70 family protein n=1 Tax=Aporhodopirellula aestuarii TaxID=2950107 RepID=A0ABT0TZY1_9BACT|nr:hsp70 family protein [Aporhodopirellula aestuarii]MCM2370162.1 hsp70 family protein [Aporhodopirellula aestuarii]
MSSPDQSSPETSSSTDIDSPPRYCVGIDLGTTNCVLAYVDTDAESRRVEVFSVPQWVDLDILESRTTLPSFHYTLTDSEIKAAEAAKSNRQLAHFLVDPLNERVGEHARVAGSSHPGRLIASAKSWLSHEGVDRSSDLLPWHGDGDVTKKSPMAASAAYLAHLRSAWDAVHPEHPMAQQDVVITLPASFDEVARELTVAAAAQAGLPRIQLIEEPQAAFYAWLDRHTDDWTDRVRVGQLILVCDIGGGTTDLTLIRVRPAATRQSGEEGDVEVKSGAVQFHRIAVGKHLILGGDNLDLAIAKDAESRLDSALPARRWQRLVAAARGVKEMMLSPGRPSETTIHLSGEGSSLIGDSISLTVTAEQVDRVLLDGFFPEVPLDASVIGGQSGFQELGLPYAADPAITKHLAEFLRAHRDTGVDDDAVDSRRVDLVLFNGGVLRSGAIQDRLVDCLAKWFGGEDSHWRPETLQSPRLDLAVAQGAAYYALVRRGEGVRIAANLARTYFMQISQSPPRAVCMIPADAQAGQTYRIDSLPMELRVGVPVSFPLWVSSTRLADRPGDVVDIDASEMTALPPIHTALRDRNRKAQTTLKIVIETQLSEIGTIGVYCVAAGDGVSKTETGESDGSAKPSQRKRRWKLDFDIRATLETDRDAHQGGGEASGIVDEETLEACEREIESVFVRGDEKPAKLVKRLQSSLELKRDDWPPVLLRGIWESLVRVEPQRRRSPAHESRWLNLLGYSLRPGYGVAVDDWRTSQTWRLLFGKIAHDDPQTRAETLILWRRIAGGLTDGQQAQLASVLKRNLMSGTLRPESAEALEAWRLAGSLERLPIADKLDLTRAALRQLERKNARALYPALLWAIGRMATRIPAYGPINLVIGTRDASNILQKLLTCPAVHTPAATSSKQTGHPEQIRSTAALALTQLSRRCHDRFRDLDDSDRQRVLRQLEDLDAPAHFLRLVAEGGQFDHEEQEAIFGDSLPLGIELR